MSERVRVGIVGASGYTGGEALRLLLGHPRVEVVAATSESNAGRFAYSVHPNLRKRTDLKFVPASELRPCDVLLLCLPHGSAVGRIDEFRALAPKLIDLSADFRLRDPAEYARWYGQPHPRPELLAEAVYGLPELHRDAIRGASLVSGVGCNATATILALYPLGQAGLIEGPVICEVKVGSSEGGAQSSPGSHHPERSGAMRSFAPTGHRHTAEVVQALSFGGHRPDVHLSITSVEAVRGVLATAHCFLKEDLDERALWRVYREHYGPEPFVRIVKERQGIHRYPEPKILAGSNFADVGFERDPNSRRVVALCAIDNLMKGAAGSAVQCLNLMCGFEETLGLEFAGLHPC